MPTKKIEDIYISTREGRELHRIRQSFTFNLGIQMVQIIKNPLNLILFPYRLFQLLLGGKKPLDLRYEPYSDYLIIGVDKTGEFYSRKALKLAERLQSTSSTEVTLISNSQSGPLEDNQIQWFRLPAARENNFSRKQWNITIERMLSTAIALSRPQKIIFFGDYLYRGIINSLEDVDESVIQLWFYSEYPDASHLENKKYSRIEKVCVPSNTPIPRTSDEIIGRYSRTGPTFIVDLKKSNQHIFDILQAHPDSKILAIQRKDRLPQGISSTINMTEIVSLPFIEGVFLIVDESSKIMPELASIQLPCVLFLGERINSPVIAEMVSDLELYKDLVVSRRSDIDSIEQSIDYLTSRDIDYNLKKGRDDYVIKWLGSLGID